MVYYQPGQPGDLWIFWPVTGSEGVCILLLLLIIIHGQWTWAWWVMRAGWGWRKGSQYLTVTNTEKDKKKMQTTYHVLCWNFLSKKPDTIIKSQQQSLPSFLLSNHLTFNSHTQQKYSCLVLMSTNPRRCTIWNTSGWSKDHRGMSENITKLFQTSLNRWQHHMILYYCF